MGCAGNFAAMPRPLPLGEVAKSVGFDGEGEPTPRSGAANAVFLYVPSREKGFQESPQTFLKPKTKNILSADYG